MEERVSYTIGVLRKRSLLVVTLAVLLLSVFAQFANAQATEDDKAQVALQVARKWMKVGVEQYNRRMYGPAEKSFLFAKDYQEYLPEAEQKSLMELLENVQKAASERTSILEHIELASQLVKEEKLIEARKNLQAIKGNEYLTDAEAELVAESLAKIDAKLVDEKKGMMELYNSSVDFFNADQFAQSREGFLKVAESGLLAMPDGYTANDYLRKIDKALLASSTTEPCESCPTTEAITVTEPEAIVMAEPEAIIEPEAMANPEAIVEAEPAESKKDEDSYISKVQQRIALIRGHVLAVINDTISKVSEFIEVNDYDKAREVIEDAERIVNQNHVALGDYLFKQYSGQLQQLSEKVALGHEALLKQQEDERRQAALAAQIKYRENMEIDRANRISDLMNNANTYQKEQRYEEALGQLQLLLTIDPQNDSALTQKQLLEDLISFRKDLEVHKEIDVERVNTFREVDETSIPYAEPMNHPKNWAELFNKRQPEAAMGQDPADLAVYDKLEEIVDLSVLSPEMSLNDAIDELKNSVDPSLRIVVLWKDLYDNAGIDQTTLINMDAQPSIRLGTALELLLKSVSGGFTEINYVVENGVITIGTVGSLPVKMVTNVYDITVLLGKKADYATSGGRRQGSSGRGGSSSGSSGSGGMDEQDFDDYDDEYDEQNQETSEQRKAATKERETALMSLIQETIDPDSWFDLGGEGTLRMYEQKKLIVYQTPENQRKVDALIRELGKSLGHEIAIESRFLLVTENFIEDIGVDFDFVFKPDSDNWGLIQVDQGSYTAVSPVDSGFPGTFVGARGLDLSANYFGSILGNLQASLLLRALQGHSDSMSLTAPKVTVLSGEAANFKSRKVIRFALPPETNFYNSNFGSGGSSSQSYKPRQGRVSTSVDLNVTPTITSDKMHVLLNIVAELQDFLGFKISESQAITSNGVVTLQQTLPQTERSSIRTRVSVPDCGTLLLGGMKLSAATEREAGTPVVGKLPIIGRLFRNKSNVKDTRVLLILVRPTIILQEEKDAEALDRLANSY